MKQEPLETESIFDKFLHLLIDVENYQTPFAQVVGDPVDIYEPLIRKKALQAGGLSFVSSLPTGILGSLTSFSEIYLLFQLQARMVKDIAAIYGKERQLNKEIMLYCLFKKSHPSLFERSLRFIGNRVLLRPMSYSTFIHVIESNLGKEWAPGNKRWVLRSLYVLNALTCGGIAYIDTRIVGFTASQIFSKEIIIES